VDVWRDPIVWGATLFTFVAMSAAAAYRYGTWAVLLTKGDILPIAVTSAFIGLATFDRRGR
jgi:hypothetical protein